MSQLLNQVIASIPAEMRTSLAEAHERYFYFAGVYTDRPKVDSVAQDRVTFQHLLQFTADGRPSISDELCADFMAAITGLPRDWCVAVEAAEFANEHGEGFFDKLKRLQDSASLEAMHLKSYEHAKR